MSKRSARIFQAGLVVGTLDITAALLYYFVKTGNNPVLILKYIASALFGKAAYSSGNKMIVAGLALHFIIAFAFTLLFFLIYQAFNLLRRSILLTGIIYGLFIWVVMNLIVVPLSKIPAQPFNLENRIANMIMLNVCIGLPLSYMAANYYHTART
ncbi:hypothetical protein EXU57_00715 [Segetibacter sp. 3557_3]|uniref:hypothetical protein n=1 Tax=Segetibacter sp. 3557_3 TaxID=2547429 RepID=UPI0010590FA1|nr:hypothetical protein [Segetibacter sp. 3557_3]TDH28632.1 hypothetical protein EXU57_00715 [Segetibacter sp. 3557_3]